MADRRKEQNKKAQQRFREKRQKEVEELKSSFRSLKDEMSNLQSTLDAAQKENSALRSRLDKQVPASASQDCTALGDEQGTSFFDYLDTKDHASHSWLDDAVGMGKSNSPQAATVVGSPGLFFDRDEVGTPLFCGAAPATGEGDSQVADVGQNEDRNTMSQNAMCSNTVLNSPQNTGIDSTKGPDYGVVHENGSKPRDPASTVDDYAFLPNKQRRKQSECGTYA